MITSYYNKLKEGLEEFAWSGEPRIEPSPINTYPLFLLLTAKPNLVGFVALDKQPEENFCKGFQNFKDLYSIRSNEWADFDLTLVLCKTDGKKVLDEFCNKIELDPYFCRKCVIDLNKSLKAELGGLPFVPLSPESVVGFKRPVSAQTFLMKHGVNTNLARYLVVPHAKGKEKIVEECIDGYLGSFEWFEKESKEFIFPQYESVSEVRQKRLEIRNFRAYRGTHEFDLDADLVVLFGPNGFGKTSFFDALDFAYTGGVGRFDERFGRKTHRLLGTLKHLDSKLEDSFVKATIFADGKEVLLERFLKDKTRASVNGGIQDRTKVLLFLTGLLEEPPDVRIENLVQLFRATHLFGQEYQSLTAGFREYSRLPGDTVSRMLAFQDYVEAFNKASLVSEELTRRIRSSEEKVSFFKAYLNSKKDEIERLRNTATMIEAPESVSAKGREIAEKIIGEAHLSISIPEEFNKGVIRAWRGMIASEIGSLKERVQLMESLEAKLPQMGSQKANLEKHLAEIKEKRTLIEGIMKEYSEKAEILRKSDENIKKMLLRERELSLKKESFDWLVKAKNEYGQLKQQFLEEEKRKRDSHAEILALPNVERLKLEVEIVRESVNRREKEIKALENSLKELDDFEREVDEWVKVMGLQKEIEADLLVRGQELINRKKELGIKREELNVSAILCERLRNKIDSLEQSQSEMVTLLGNIEKFVLSNVCPVCGTSHESRDELINRLRSRRGFQPTELQEEMKSYEFEKGKYGQLKKNVSELDLQVKQLEEKSVGMQKERLRIEEKMRRYREKTSKLDIPTTGENLQSMVSSKRKKISEELNLGQQALSAEKSKAKKSEEEMSVLLRRKKNLEQDLITEDRKLGQLSSMMERIGSDASGRQVSLELENEVIEHELNEIGIAMANLGKQISIYRKENESLRREVDSLIEKKSSLEEETDELDRVMLSLRKRIEELGNLQERLNVSADVDIDQVRVLKEDIVKKLSCLDALQNQVINFEIALDATEVSAALAKIQQDTEKTEQQLQVVENEQSQLSSWLLYFNIIRERLELLQNQALREYTDKYGPLTSTIQRRLRSVYGFGEIGLYPGNGGIAVRVERKGEKNISPSDYFSESQIQIVMLSLFLSAALTQTWSSFAPILLDDPVEHFDDLNAYSLLDLIRGLITEPGKRHQFIISTCEDRLFRLMRQKFSKIDGKVIFYVFESIGDSGPKISKSYY